MRILDRYVSKSVLSTFFSCVFTFLFLYVIIDILTNLEDIIKQKTHIELLAQYYLANLPSIFTQVAPFTCLLSTLYTFGRMNHANEIIAMRSAGQSVYQVTKTAIILGFIVSLLIFWMNDKIIPRSMHKINRVREQIQENLKKTKQKKADTFYNLSMYGSKNTLIFVNRFSAATNTMDGITILEHDEHQNITKKIVANRGVFKNHLWTFYQSITYNFDKNGQVIGEPDYFEEEIMSIPETPHDFITQRQRPELMTISQLDNYIWKLSRSGATSVIRNLKVDLYQRFASPFTSVIIILLGIPFALRLKRRAGLSSIGLSIVFAFLYYMIDAISCALGRGGVLHPAVAVSLSHVIMFLSGLYLISHLP
ncbi:MAG: LptF/LptG family permease [Candidatus Omnitrophica bacterium]|nr:LptF/LptG family permease [Candidatus Omnitrophota bacterium]